MNIVAYPEHRPQRRIVAPTSIRWWWGSSWTITVSRSVLRCGRGNTTDVTTLVPAIKRLRSRFSIGRICIVSDRGMISAETMDYIEEEKISYILDARMRRSKELKEEVLSRAGRYREVHPEGVLAKDPSPLKVKEVMVDGRRYIVCLNEKQARKDAADRQAIIDSLQEKLILIERRRCGTAESSSRPYPRETSL